ncbi:hypothetical protein [Streptomyces sp. NPDC127112]|uniref:hypothetical protein n=1 Tax=Streptomyces sp. NPDC127112 TaxID=3345364 RepID=UPI0036383556
MREYSWPGENGRHVPDTASAWAETVRALPIGTRHAGRLRTRHGLTPGSLFGR